MSERLSHTDLTRLLERGPKPGSRFRHYKTGNVYRLEGVAVQESDCTLLVLYRQEKPGCVLFARPLAEWNEIVSRPDGNGFVERFESLEKIP